MLKNKNSSWLLSILILLSKENFVKYIGELLGSDRNPEHLGGGLKRQVLKLQPLWVQIRQVNPFLSPLLKYNEWGHFDFVLSTEGLESMRRMMSGTEKVLNKKAFLFSVKRTYLHVKDNKKPGNDKEGSQQMRDWGKRSDC